MTTTGLKSVAELTNNYGGDDNTLGLTCYMERVLISPGDEVHTHTPYLNTVVV